MPWEKAFDVDKAVENAMTLFWEKGYTESSMAGLLKVTGLTKGSFYNAFGSKRALFIKSLLKYDIENRRAMLQELAAMDQPRQAIEEFFKRIIQSSANDDNKKGCFLINTSLDLSSHDQQTREIVINALKEVELFFKQMIELGQIRGEMAASINPQTMAKSLLGTLVSIRVLCRGVFDVDELYTLANNALQTIH